MTEADRIQLHDLVSKHLDALGEHFDSVRIFVTKQSGADTLGFSKGQGNRYASFGQITEWIDTDKAQTIWSQKAEP